LTAEFVPYPKIPRLNREVIVTEKIDGTNACVVVDEDGNVSAQSRSRVIVPGNDNFGFAGWVFENAPQLKLLGPGYHFGEWWGKGIQRGYGLEEKRFSLFHTGGINELPGCVSVVPKLDAGLLSSGVVDRALNVLRVCGSVAAPGFDKPEGVVVFHSASRQLFKVLLEGDDIPKGAAA
jgi:hypothetical protein